MPIVFTGRVFSVEVDRKQFPNGRTHEVAIVRHPPAVVRELWEVPAGSVDEGESPEAAAKRECEEEIGRVPRRLERLGAWYPTPGYCDEEMIFFRATDLREPPPGSPHRRDEDEDITAQPVTAAEARAMVARGDIIDLKTAYALAMLDAQASPE